VSKTILVVDDNFDVLLSIENTLRPFGFTIVTASSGRECLDILEKSTPDLILLDIMMPDIDGWNVASKIKEHPQWKDIPLIFVTAKTDDMSISLGSFASSEYIIKPFDPKDLINAVNKIFT
jgi:CheY-like chemotaxis protein